jgi:hypothetical protein
MRSFTRVSFFTLIPRVHAECPYGHQQLHFRIPLLAVEAGYMELFNSFQALPACDLRFGTYSCTPGSLHLITSTFPRFTGGRSQAPFPRTTPTYAEALLPGMPPKDGPVQLPLYRRKGGVPLANLLCATCTKIFCSSLPNFRVPVTPLIRYPFTGEAPKPSVIPSPW